MDTATLILSILLVYFNFSLFLKMLLSLSTVLLSMSLQKVFSIQISFKEYGNNILNLFK